MNIFRPGLITTHRNETPISRKDRKSGNKNKYAKVYD